LLAAFFAANAKITCSSQVYFIVIFPCLPLVEGKPSFSLAKNIIVPNSPTYAWRTVFFLAKNLNVPTFATYRCQTVFSSSFCLFFCDSAMIT